MKERNIFQSFKYAVEGLMFIVTHERNMKIQLISAFIAITLSVGLRVSEIEFIFIVFAIALVLISEVANTGFELLLDFVHGDEFHPNVKILKDVAAGGVLIASFSALLIGCIIFIPKIIVLLHR